MTDKIVEKFNVYINDEELLGRMETDIPGFSERVRQFKVAVEHQRRVVLESWGLDPDEIAEIFEEVDVE